MTSLYLPAALTTSPRVIEVRALLLVACLLPSLARPEVTTPTPAPAALSSYTAEYRTTARGFELTVTRRLETNDGQHYILTNEGRILVLGYHEISVFSVQDGEIRPISYVYQGTGLINRRRELRFLPDQGLITSLYKGETYQLPYRPHVLDRMNQLEQLRLVRLRQPEPATDLSWPVADRKRVKESRLVMVAEETLDTPLGPVATVHYERLHSGGKRKSDFWFAPRWDYLMVRTVHIEDGDPVEMMITSASIDGIPVAPD